MDWFKEYYSEDKEKFDAFFEAWLVFELNFINPQSFEKEGA